MASHRTHYENGCKFGRETLPNGRKLGDTLVKFNASRFAYRCQACNKAAFQDGYDIQTEKEAAEKEAG